MYLAHSPFPERYNILLRTLDVFATDVISSVATQAHKLGEYDYPKKLLATVAKPHLVANKTVVEEEIAIS